MICLLQPVDLPLSVAGALGQCCEQRRCPFCGRKAKPSQQVGCWKGKLTTAGEDCTSAAVIDTISSIMGRATSASRSSRHRCSAGTCDAQYASPPLPILSHAPWHKAADPYLNALVIRSRRARLADLLCGLPLQPFNRDQPAIIGRMMCACPIWSRVSSAEPAANAALRCGRISTGTGQQRR
jgi:hypothetical protein